MASLLATAERLGMTVVGNPDALKQLEPSPAPATESASAATTRAATSEASREEPVAAARRAV